MGDKVWPLYSAACVADVCRFAHSDETLVKEGWESERDRTVEEMTR